MRVSINGGYPNSWLIMENPMNMDDWRVPGNPHMLLAAVLAFSFPTDVFPGMQARNLAVFDIDQADQAHPIHFYLKIGFRRKSN